jgi:hypothetical protein
MATVPQVHPLWLAEARERDVRAGRVVAWQVTGTGTAPGGATAAPLVAFTTPDGLLLETSTPHGPLVYLADTRDEALAAAGRVAAAAPGDGPDGGPGPPAPPPLPADDEDDPRPPDPRTRVLTLRRLTPDEPPGGPAAGQPGQPGQAAPRIHRHDI